MPKFEHRTQRVASLPVFAVRMGRYTLFAVAMVVFSLGIGMVGYRYTAQISWLDSFYMASMILTGMGPVVPITTTGAKVFSSLYSLYSGVMFLGATAVFLSPVVHRLLHILHVDINLKDN